METSGLKYNVDINYESCDKKTETQEWVHTIKREPEEDNERNSKSNMMKQDNADIQVEIAPLPPECFVECKLEDWKETSTKQLAQHNGNKPESTSMKQDAVHIKEELVSISHKSELTDDKSMDNLLMNIEDSSSNASVTSFPGQEQNESDVNSHEEQTLSLPESFVCTEMESVSLPYSCIMCAKSYIKKSRLNRHMKTHTSVKPFSCHLCDKKFTRKESLNRHVYVHTGIRPHSCDQCSKTFSLRKSLIRHLSIHSGVKPHACSLCAKTFTLKHHLSNHMVTHSKLKSYKCTQCVKSFTHINSLRRHMNLHNRS